MGTYVLRLELSVRCYADVPEAFARSFSSIFLLAAKIISSLFLCRFDWRSLRSALQAFVLGFSSGDSGVWLSFDVRLYRVIRSGCDGLAAAATGLVGTTGAGAAGCWNDAGACRMSVLRCLSAGKEELTLSRDLPLSTLSVVAAAFPPFLCRSHAMSLLFSCGNIWAIVSICAGSMRVERVALGRVPFAEGLLEYQRYTRKATTANTMTCGMLMLCSAMFATCGGCERECGGRVRGAADLSVPVG
jgi:hypothetical protein